jgi:hypothetical protein
LLGALTALPALAQNSKLKGELQKKETAAKKDPEQLLAVAKWASENSLADDAKRIYQAILKIQPDNKGANEGLGNELVEGKWMPAKEAAALRKQAIATENAAKGLVEVGGVWVEKDKVDDAKRGIYHFENDVVTKEEIVALQSGKVRHPETGELIDAKDAEKAKSDLFLVNGKWVDRKEADTFHSDFKRPWIIRTGKGMFVSTLSRDNIQKLERFVDRGIEEVMPLFGNKVLTPAHRPVVIVAATRSEYTDFGQPFGDGTDACGTYLMREEAKMKLPYLGEVRPGICVNDKDWGSRYIRHAAALAYANGCAEEAGVDLPLWFLHAVGSYTSRFETDSDAGFLGRGRTARNLKGFFASFAISGDMESKDIATNIYLAGLMLSYAVKGGDAKCTEAMQAVTAILAGTAKGNFAKALTALQQDLIASEAKVEDYLQKLVAKGPK